MTLQQGTVFIVPSNVMMEASVPLILATLLVDVSTQVLYVMTRMLVLGMHVISLMDATTLRSAVMITMPVLLTLATLLRDVLVPLLIAMTTIFAPKIIATLLLDVNLLLLAVCNQNRMLLFIG